MASLLFLLLWKNFLIKIRHPIVLVFELAIPCLFIVLLAYVRRHVEVTHVDEPTEFESFNVHADPDIFKSNSREYKIFYTPSSNETRAFMHKYALDNRIAIDKVVPFKTEAALEKEYLALNSPDIFCAIVIKSIDSSKLDIKIRFPYTQAQRTRASFTFIDKITWQTKRLFPIFHVPGPRGKHQEGGPPFYYGEKFLAIQKGLTDTYTSLHVSGNESLENNITVNLKRMPYPAYEIDRYSLGLQFFFPLVIMLSFIYPTINQTKIIVLEKEQRFTSMASMMGLSPSLQWFSHFLTAFVFNSISVVIMVAVMAIPISGNLRVLQHSDPTLVLTWLLLYLFSCIMFCFMMSAFFSRANMAGVVCGSVFFVSFLPYYRINLVYDSTPLFQKLGLSMIFNTNMSLGAMLLSMFECKQVGFRWNQFFEPASPEDDLTIFALFCTNILSSLLYLLIALYVSAVFPGEYGIPRPWYYFVTREYWFESAQKQNVQKTSVQRIKPSLASNRGSTTTIEMSSLGSGKRSLSVGQNFFDDFATSIEMISKTYDGGKTWAVKDFSMDMVQDEITVLLGHNGAGKTTLMSMLCGLIPPTSGDITIFNMDLRSEIDLIRQNLGICPQFDVLFDDLTVSEHLYFYCVLKRIPAERIQSEIDSMISMLDLIPKTHQRSAKLSGGMKRKLSVGIALIGGSRFVLLDEATSGMDVSARRFIWDLLIKEKKNRAILLSTHFMEEADVLGDKIAIVEGGQMKCFGTPMELKKEYGYGYLLKIGIKKSSIDIVAGIKGAITGHINGAKSLTEVGNEITFSLPEIEKPNFTKLFTKLEDDSERLNILSYGISVTTIEEVFLRVGDYARKGMNQFNEMAKILNDQQNHENEIVENLRPGALKFNSGLIKFFQIVRAMFLKKLNFVFHNRFLLFAQFLLPPFVLLLSILNNKNRAEMFSDSPELPFVLKSYRDLDFVSFYEHDSLSRKVDALFRKMIMNSGLREKELDSVEDNGNFTVDEYLLAIGEKDILKYDLYNLFAVSSKIVDMDDSTKLSITGWFSNRAYHGAPTIFNIINNLALQTIDEKYELKFSNHPLPKKASEGLTTVTMDAARNVSVCNAITFSVSFLLGSFIILIVNETVNNFRHIQQISSLETWLYWLTHFLLDYVFWLFSALVLSLVIYVTNIEPLNEIEEIFYIFISLALFGFPALPFTYLLSFMVSDPATGYVRLSLMTLIMGIVTFVAVIILRIPEFDLLELSTTNENILQYILPIFTLPMQIYSIAKNRMSKKLCNTTFNAFGANMTLLELCTIPKAVINSIVVNPYAFICCADKCDNLCFIHRDFLDDEKPGSLQFIIGYGVQTVIYWSLIAIVEVFGHRLSSLWSTIVMFCRWNKQPIDARREVDTDVIQEEERIMKTSMNFLSSKEAMLVRKLRKDYGNFTAVDNISFGVNRSECFGILGVNGAGKTTTFKMITGAERITSGDIIINKMNVKNEMSKIFKIIGYCPQFNGLLDELTGRQTLEIISRIRGIHERMIDKQIDILAKLFFFEEHINKPVGTYSGGTKRKLSMACSIVGNPMLVFLDEPSTGVDPVSRRCLWNAVQALRSAGSSIVLTSHSMEECEALCNRLIIMVNAKIRCIGSPLQLKNKFGHGCIIQIKCKRKTKKATIQRLIEHLAQHYDSKCRLESNHNKLLTFRLESNDYPLSQIFGFIEQLMASKEYKIEDYAVTQTSLERIFLSFAREQVEASP